MERKSTNAKSLKPKGDFVPFIKKASFVASLLMGAGAIATPSNAQEAAPEDVSGDAGDIVVTAQKSGAQSLLDVPLSISAIDSSTLANAGVQDLADIAKLSPGLQLTETFGRSGNYLAIRGVSGSVTGTPTVQVFEDGFTTGLASNINGALVDLERVEILKGPQATLYGANAIGGVINYITKKPGPKTEAGLRLSYGELDELNLSGNVSGQAFENVFAGFAASYHRRDGFLDNIATGKADVNDQEDLSVRGALRITPGDATTIDFTASYSWTADGCGDCSYIPTDFPLPAAPGDTSLRDGLVDVNSYDRVIDQNYDNRLRRWTDTQVLNIEHDFGGVTLTSITGRGRIHSIIEFDLGRAATRVPALSLPVLSDKYDESISQEVRLASDGAGGLRWVIGGYASRIDTDSSAFLGGALINQTLSKTTNYAAFANVEFPITDSFTLGGGLRYDYQKVSGENVLFAIDGAFKSEELLPRITAEYRFGDSGILAYATASKGYKSGGVNIGTPDPTVPAAYAPEYLWNYEAGFKGRLFDRRLSFTLAAFRMNWTDRQVQLLDSSGLFTYQANLGKAHINGAELAIDVNAGGGFSIAASGTYMDAKVDRYIDLSGLSDFYVIDRDLRGNRLPSAPKFSFTVSPEFETPLSGDWRLRARADVSYTGALYFDAQNLLRQDARTLVNTFLSVERDHFEVGLFARNLFDKRYHTSGNLSTLGPFMTTAAPRVIGVKAAVRY